MRIHGNQRRRCRVIVALTVFLLAVRVPLTGQALPAGHAEMERRRAEEEKSRAEEEKSRAESEADTLEQKLEESRQQEKLLDDKLTRLLTMEDILKSDMEELKNQINEAAGEYGKAEKKRQQQYDVLKRRIRFLYEEGDVTYLDILLKAKNIGDVVSQTEYFRQLYEYDRTLIREYERIRDEAAGKKELLEEKQSQMEVMEEEYQSQQRELEGFIRTRQRESSDFAEELEDARERAGKAAGEVKRKTEEIRILKARQEQERIRQEQVRREQEERTGHDAPEPGFSAGPGAGAGSASSGKVPIKSTGGTEFGRSVADYALQFVGNPYVYGGTSLTNGADCSGYTQSVYRHFGVSIPRTSAEQSGFGQEIAYGDMEPGDLVCYSGHVAMYIGGGRIVHASSRKEGIKVSDNPAYRTIVSIRRPWQAGETAAANIP